MVDLRTSDSMIADKVKPKISDQVTCEVIDPAMPSACSSPCTMFTAERPPVRRSSTAGAGNGLAVLFLREPQQFRDFRRLPTLANAPRKVLVMRRSRVRLPQAAPTTGPVMIGERGAP